MLSFIERQETFNSPLMEVLGNSLLMPNDPIHGKPLVCGHTSHNLCIGTRRYRSSHSFSSTQSLFALSTLSVSICDPEQGFAILTWIHLFHSERNHKLN